ncbi:MAG: hypothetical protein WD627_10780 [Actinomycetota bacterium]
MTQTKSRKPRSPAAPSRTLNDALADVRKLYDTYTHSSFSRAEIASALGVSASSGPFSQRLYTHREFGLIEGTGDGYKVSQAFLEMNNSDPQNPQFKRRALEAIKRSPVFKELLDEWKVKLPPQEAVAKRLEQQKLFNPDRAKAIANTLEQSLRQAGVLDSSNNILPIRHDEERSAHVDHSKDNVNGRRAEGTVGDDARFSAGKGNSLKTEIPIGDGRQVVVSYPTDLTTEEAQKVGNVLRALVG